MQSSEISKNEPTAGDDIMEIGVTGAAAASVAIVSVSSSRVIPSSGTVIPLEAGMTTIVGVSAGMGSPVLMSTNVALLLNHTAVQLVMVGTESSPVKSGRLSVTVSPFNNLPLKVKFSVNFVGDPAVAGLKSKEVSVKTPGVRDGITKAVVVLLQ